MRSRGVHGAIRLGVRHRDRSSHVIVLRSGQAEASSGTQSGFIAGTELALLTLRVLRIATAEPGFAMDRGAL